MCICSVETTVLVDTLGPARRETYGLCVSVRWQCCVKYASRAEIGAIQIGAKSSNCYLIVKAVMSKAATPVLFNGNSSSPVAAVMSKANDTTVGSMYKWLRYLCVIGIAAYT